MSRYLLTIISCAGLFATARAAATDSPNILWITTEDIGPHLGCYGDACARTPNLDALAAKGILYRNVWSNAPVCAPARTAIIIGVSPTSTGAEHMRSEVACPPVMQMYPQLLRKAGYYCTNNSKEDYNLIKPGPVWDESSPKAHWRNRKPGQPFFAVFNILVTHESQIRKRPHDWKQDPAKVRIPARQPDTPEMRQDWAQYYDQIAQMDGLAAARLRELNDAGVADNTIVFFYGDNGPGMPGYKRSARDAGLHVPLIVYVPPGLRQLAPQDTLPGAKSDRLLSFIDLAPTVLSLAGVAPPEWMQGRAFMGTKSTPEPAFIHGFRGRMDERYDLVRCMRDRRYVYVRNYMPHLPEGQHVAYMFETPSTRAWKRLYDEGKLASPQSTFWERRPPEELYDLQTDPDEARNLASLPEQQERLVRMRQALRDHLLTIRDVGFLPEGEIHARSRGSSPYEMGRDEGKYPLERILAAAELASSLDEAATRRLRAALLDDPDSAVRYWAAMGILMRGQPAVSGARAALETALRDSSLHVRIVAAEALARYGGDRKSDDALAALLDAADGSRHDVYIAVFALNAIDRLRPQAASMREAVAKLPRAAQATPARMKSHVPSLIDSILAGAQ